jgi:hypothetical protein
LELFDDGNFVGFSSNIFPYLFTLKIGENIGWEFKILSVPNPPQNQPPKKKQDQLKNIAFFSFNFFLVKQFLVLIHLFVNFYLSF